MQKPRNLESAKNRRSRYVASDRGGAAPKSTRSRHIEVLQALAEYRYLSSPDIGEIMGEAYAHRRILTKLFHAGFVDRRHIHTHRGGRFQGTPRAIYLLTPRGFKEWVKYSELHSDQPEYESMQTRVASRSRLKLAQPEHIEHAWGVARFQRTLERSAAKADLEVLDFRADREYGTPSFDLLLPPVVAVEGSVGPEGGRYVTRGPAEEMTLYPDGAFWLRNRRGIIRAYLFEYDNARRKHSRVRQRALAYYSLVTSDEGMEEIGKQMLIDVEDGNGGFVEYAPDSAFVVFIAPTTARRDQLIDLTLETPRRVGGPGFEKDRKFDDNAIFWFVALPDLLQEQDLRKPPPKGSDDRIPRLWTVAGDRLFDTADAIALKLDGTSSPICMKGFLT